MTAPNDRRPSRREQGNAMVMALFLTILMVGMVVTGTSTLKANRARTDTAFLLTGQAAELARSGLIEAINWFRRQPSQPVLEFAPQLDESADPPVLDTLDPDIGLVREVRIHGRIWGRYEVWKEWESDPDSERLTWRRKVNVEDVSAKRGRGSSGSVWRLRSLGYVYDRRDANADFRSYPNRVIASEMLEAEIDRLTIALPGPSAICSSAGRNIMLQSHGRALGGSEGSGIYYPNGTGSPQIKRGSTLTGVPSQGVAVEYEDDLQYVFGVSFEQLRGMADFTVEPPAEFPSPLPDGSLTVVEIGSMTFNPETQLRGSGIVVVRGNVAINSGGATNFAGVLYVDGNLQIHAPALLRGAVIVTGQITLDGVGDYADIIYDEDAVSEVMEAMGTYRMSRAARRLLGEK